MADTEIKPAIELGAVVINSVPGALDDLSCTIERLKALHWSNHSDMHDTVEDLPEGGAKERLYNYWMIFTTVGEKIAEIERIVVATCNAAHGAEFLARTGSAS